MNCRQCGQLLDSTSRFCNLCGAAIDGSEDLSAPVREGDVFEGKWRLLEKLGQGGMGSVYRAQDLSLDREVAVKVLAGTLCNDAEFVARFEREAKLTAHLDHPNVVLVYAVGKHRGRPFIVMKRLEGETLARRLQDMPRGLPAEGTLEIFRQICSGLDYIHSKGFVHRDIKAGNIFLGPDGRATILDFGILRDTRPGQNLTRAGQMMGTPHYMSPEQAMARKTDPRADIYALGILLFECLTGQLPFVGENDLATLHMQLKKPPPDPRELAPSLPLGITQVTARAMAKVPAERYASAPELLADLEAALGANPVCDEQEPTQIGRRTPARKGPARPADRARTPRPSIPARPAPPSRPSNPRAVPARAAGSLSDPRRSLAAAPEPSPLGLADDAAVFEPEPTPTPEPVPPAPVARTELPEAEDAPRSSGGGAFKVLLALLALGAVSYSVWRVVTAVEPTAEEPPDLLRPLREEALAAKAPPPAPEPSPSPKPTETPTAAPTPEAKVARPPRPAKPARAPASGEDPKAAFGALRVMTTLRGELYWATLYVDGEQRGATNRTVNDIPVGEHEIRLERSRLPAAPSPGGRQAGDGRGDSDRARARPIAGSGEGSAALQPSSSARRCSSAIASISSRVQRRPRPAPGQNDATSADHLRGLKSSGQNGQVLHCVGLAS